MVISPLTRLFVPKTHPTVMARGSRRTLKPFHKVRLQAKKRSWIVRALPRPPFSVTSCNHRSNNVRFTGPLSRTDQLYPYIVHGERYLEILNFIGKFCLVCWAVWLRFRSNMFPPSIFSHKQI